MEAGRRVVRWKPVTREESMGKQLNQRKGTRGCAGPAEDEGMERQGRDPLSLDAHCPRPPGRLWRLCLLQG